MGKPRNNKHATPRRIKTDQQRNERRKLVIAKRTEGQFRDVPPGQRQKLINNITRSRWRGR